MHPFFIAAVFLGPTLKPVFGASLLPYDESLVQHALNQSQASYCVGIGDAWTCPTCNSDIILTDVLEQGGGRAIVGYDNSIASVFVAYRGSENIKNWIDNVKFLKTSPYADLPDVAVEKGFYKWYSGLKPLVDYALLEASQAYGSNEVSITGHSAGAAVATLHAFDMARGDAATSGLTLKQVVTFGSPRVGDENFYAAHGAYLNSTVAWRVTHNNDMVPHVPQEFMGYHHVSTEVYYDEPSTAYKVCDGSGEDDNCSNSSPQATAPASTTTSTTSTPLLAPPAADTTHT
eukprot:CAMPEP_0171838434 /NCGR_PEP_ID=MMETSP0992-20121227/12760_1 /TAXON_ID=483369 /ORGANISM="non described non described, Strain CCMP2098" /LENGTH=288 /DNA_ID=CAMNT_0012454815 /DNA_START=14 /DNA_END=881 /DNA_ORIENTATION=+